jgi:hypothetical protein
MEVKKAENEFAGHKELLGGPQVEYLCSTELSPKVVVEWSTAHLRIWEIPGSNLCPDIRTEVSWFSSVPPGECQNSTLNQAMIASFHILSNSPFTYYPFHSTLYSLSH